LFETTTEGGDVAAVAGGDVDHLLDAGGEGGGGGDDDAALGLLEKLLVGLADDALGGSPAGGFDVDAVGDEEANAAVAEAGDLVVVGFAAVDRCLVEFEVAGVN